jgi:hypothetical protein
VDQALLENPLTTIDCDGRWTCVIATGGPDQVASEIALFLVPAGYSPLSMPGGGTSPNDLYRNAVAYVIVVR